MGKKKLQPKEIKEKLCLEEEGNFSEADLKGFPIPGLSLRRNMKECSGDICTSSGKRSRKGVVSRF